MNSLTRRIFLFSLTAAVFVSSTCSTAAVAQDTPTSNDVGSKKSAAKNALLAVPEILAAPFMIPLMAASELTVGRIYERNRKSSELYTQATLLGAEGKYEDAIGPLKKSVALEADYLKYETLGDYLNKLGRLQESIRAYDGAIRCANRERAFSESPALVISVARLQMKLGRSYFQENAHAKAIKAFDESLSLNPDEATLQSIREIAKEACAQSNHVHDYEALVERTKR